MDRCALDRVGGRILDRIVDNGGGVGLYRLGEEKNEAVGIGCMIIFPKNDIFMIHRDESRGSRVSPADVQYLTEIVISRAA